MHPSIFAYLIVLKYLIAKCMQSGAWLESVSYTHLTYIWHILGKQGLHLIQLDLWIENTLHCLKSLKLKPRVNKTILHFIQTVGDLNEASRNITFRRYQQHIKIIFSWIYCPTDYSHLLVPFCQFSSCYWCLYFSNRSGKAEHLQSEVSSPLHVQDPCVESIVG